MVARPMIARFRKIEAHAGKWFHFMVLRSFFWIALFGVGVVIQSWARSMEYERVLGWRVGRVHVYVWRGASVMAAWKAFKDRRT
jgi:hypothetical protein